MREDLCPIDAKDPALAPIHAAAAELVRVARQAIIHGEAISDEDALALAMGALVNPTFKFMGEASVRALASAFVTLTRGDPDKIAYCTDLFIGQCEAQLLALPARDGARPS